MGLHRSAIALSALLVGLAPIAIDNNGRGRNDVSRKGPRDAEVILAQAADAPANDSIDGVVNAPTVQAVPPSSRYNANVPLPQLVDSYVRQHGSDTLERKIIVRKESHTLGVYLNDTLLKEYRVALGHNYLGFDSTGDKQYEGDGRTPVGEFYVTLKVPNTRFYKALLISYPDTQDARRGLESRLISRAQHDAIVAANRSCMMPPQNTELGGWIEIHGRNQPGIGDWTIGCVALTDAEMDEVYEFARAGCFPWRRGEELRPRTRVIIME
ncbi:L,D-transpeptidase family protein [Candidatus Woesearchaeota archaeon]|nr:L,D-transpeptidase family protein [Candidatus Woesearchaeota archaeon]